MILAIAFIPSTGVRVILGLPFLLFFPGYTLLAALFVKKKEIDNIEWIALSCGMSIALTGLIGFGLNYKMGNKIGAGPMLYHCLHFCDIVCCVG